METPGNIIKKARKQRGFTLEKVSRETGIPISTLSSWERGANDPKEEHREILGDFFAIEPDALMKPKLEVTKAEQKAAAVIGREARTVILHSDHWALAEELRPQYGGGDLDHLIAMLIIDAKKKNVRC